MRKRLAAMAGALAILGMSAGSALAFEQTPVAPAPSGGADGGVVLDGGVAFDSETSQSSGTESGQDGMQLKLPGMGSVAVPKLNFGLDLLYGSSGQHSLQYGETQAPGNADPMPDDDLKIMGTVKRRF